MSAVDGAGLPPGWTATDLGSLVTPRSGKADPRRTPNARFVGLEQVEAHTMRLVDTVAAGTMKSSANVFEPGDVLYGRLRAYLNKVVQPDFGGLCSGEFIVMPPGGAVLGKFLKYRLNAADFVRFASSLNTGDRPRVDFDQLRTFPTLVPPLNEQARIADALDELLSDLDAGVASLEAARAKLGAYRAALLKAAVDGTLTAEWRAAHPDAEPAAVLVERVLAERRRRWEEDQLARFAAKGQQPPKHWPTKYKPPVDAVPGAFENTPSTWATTTLDALIVEGPQNGLYLPGTHYGRGRPILRIDDFQDGWTRDRDDLQLVDAADVDASNYALTRGDLVINRVNSMTHLGKCVVVTGVLDGVLFESNMMRAALAGNVHAKYVEFYLRSTVGRRRLTADAKWAVNQASINQQDVRRTALPLPPLAEQAAIVDLVEGQLSVVDHLEADLDAKLRGAQSLRQSILREAFAGRLVPQDPADEPAAVLLARIAAERGAAAPRRRASARKRPVRGAAGDIRQQLSWDDTARAMAAAPEAWSEWDATLADGLDPAPHPTETP